MKNFTISPEHPVGGGQLDFLVTAPIADGTTASVCVEFKFAHAKDVIHGASVQLPAYMRAQGSDNGIYCVLWCKCKQFDKPKRFDSPDKLYKRLTIGRVTPRNIKVQIIDIAPRQPPSRARAPR